MNKDCLQEEEIWDYIDGELEMSAYCKVRSHLEECPTCKSKYQEIRSLNSHLVVGFQQEFFSCDEVINFKTGFGKCVTCPSYSRKWAGLWQKLLFSNVAAFCSAFMVIVFFSPNIEGLSCISELNILRQSIYSLFQSVL